MHVKFMKLWNIAYMGINEWVTANTTNISCENNTTNISGIVQ